MRGYHYDVLTKRSVGPVAVGTTGTGQTGKIVDRKGYRRVEFIFSYGAMTATSAVVSVVVKEGDVTGTMTSIADADLEGTELLAGVAAAATRTSDVSKLVTKRLGYKGSKRYVQVSKLSSTVTAATVVGAVVLLSEPESSPTSPAQ